MIDVKNAQEIVKKIPDRNFLIECSDFGKFYGFVFADQKPSPDEFFGGGYDCINKDTGDISHLILVMTSHYSPIQHWFQSMNFYN